MSPVGFTLTTRRDVLTSSFVPKPLMILTEYGPVSIPICGWKINKKTVHSAPMPVGTVTDQNLTIFQPRLDLDQGFPSLPASETKAKRDLSTPAVTDKLNLISANGKE